MHLFERGATVRTTPCLCRKLIYERSAAKWRRGRRFGVARQVVFSRAGEAGEKKTLINTTSRCVRRSDRPIAARKAFIRATGVVNGTRSINSARYKNVSWRLFFLFWFSSISPLRVASENLHRKRPGKRLVQPRRLCKRPDKTDVM